MDLTQIYRLEAKTQPASLVCLGVQQSQPSGEKPNMYVLFPGSFFSIKYISFLHTFKM